MKYTSLRPVQQSYQLLVESLNLAPSNSFTIQFLRSLVVSVVALFFDFGLLIVFKQVLGINYLIAATISFIVGVAVNYILSVTWVFAEHKLSSRHAEMFLFLMINVAGLGLNLFVIGGLVEFTHVDYRIAKGISTAVVFFWNFILRKKILY